MEKEKCIVFDFSQGKRKNPAFYQYKTDQLDLDLEIEVRSPEPAYRSNILNFNDTNKIKENGSSREELEKPFNIA